MTTFQAARNGMPGDATAVNDSDEVNQLLITGAPISILYTGDVNVTSTTGAGYGGWFPNPEGNQFDQPIVPTQTTVGRVEIPVRAVGDGADLLVQLCHDNGGVPGTVITSCRVPKQWIKTMGAFDSIPQARTVDDGTGAVVAIQEALRLSNISTDAFNSPQVSSDTDGYLLNPSTVLSSAGWMLFVGGVNFFSFNAVTNCYSAKINPDGTLGPLVPQSPLPAATAGAAVVLMDDDTLVAAGGQTAQVGGTLLSTVYTARFDPTTGQIGAWSTQTAMPTAFAPFGIAQLNGYVYISNGTVSPESVYYAQVSSGVISLWNTNAPPGAVIGLVASGGQLRCPSIYMGSLTDIPTAASDVNADGSIAGWVIGPSITNPGVELPALISTGSGMAMLAGVSLSSGLAIAVSQTASADRIGFGLTAQQVLPAAFQSYSTGDAIPLGSGQWLAVAVATGSSSHGANGTAIAALINLVPMISLPLPAGVFNDGTVYHVVMVQEAVDENNYLEFWGEHVAMPNHGQWRGSGGGLWNSNFTSIRPPGLDAVTDFAFPVNVMTEDPTGVPRATVTAFGQEAVSILQAGPGQPICAVAESTQFGDGTRLSSVDALYYDDDTGALIAAQRQS